MVSGHVMVLDVVELANSEMLAAGDDGYGNVHL